MTNTATGILAFVVVAGLILVALGGCSQANQHTAINQAALAGRAAVQSADSLLIARQITIVDAKAVLDSGVAVRVSLGAWEASVLASNTAAVTPSKNAASADLQAMVGTVASLPAPRNEEIGRKLLNLKPATGPAVTGAKKITPAAVVAIIQLAADLTPKIVTWINAAFNKTAVTADTVAETFREFDADLAKLRADITAAGG